MYGADGSITFDITSSGNLEFGTTTGSKIGTATNQKLSFWNATPIIQPSGDVLTALSNLGLVSSPTLSGLSASAVGTINLWASSTVPDGWILCDGASLLRTGTYAGLFAVIGTTYGTADGTHFNVPDMRGIFAKGAGTTNRTLGKDANGNYYSGTLGTYLTDKMQGHWHYVSRPLVPDQYITHDGNQTANTKRINLYPTITNYSGNSGTLAPDTTMLYGLTMVSDTSNGTPRIGVTTEPQSLALNYIIKYAGASVPDSGLIVASPISGSGSTSSPLTIDLSTLTVTGRIRQSAGTNPLDLLNSGTTQTWDANGSNIDFYSGGDRLYIKSNGNVGIGTTAPGSKLTVAGQVSITGASRVRAVRGTTQSIPNATWTKVQFATEEYDNLGEYDNATNYRFIATEAGYYSVNASVLLNIAAMPAGSGLELGLYKNNSLYAQGFRNYVSAAVTTYMSSVLSTDIYLAANDYIEIWVYQSQGAAVNLIAATIYNYFSVHRSS